MTSPKKRPRGKISDKMRVNFLARVARDGNGIPINFDHYWFYYTRDARGNDYPHRVGGIRPAIDAAIRASKSKGGV